MKKILRVLMIAFILTIYSVNTLAWVPVVSHGYHNTSNRTNRTKVKTDGQEIYKHSLGILIGKEIRDCKIIDAFYWDHKINMICIRGNSFYKMRVIVNDMIEEETDEGYFKGHYWDVDVTKEVADIFQGEIND
jgi:hypothetical protein